MQAPHAIALDTLGIRPSPYWRTNISRADIIAEIHAKRLYDESTKLLDWLISERSQLPFFVSHYSKERLNHAIAAARRRQRRRFNTWLWLSGQAHAEMPVASRQMAG